ncbi:hypothetical protein FOZ61_009135 [Perkinsus olseni]|uniref:Fatty acid hydroxylase domain-containing protein n=1 Tax=Perkinsus olseni TaxID=32597 RepID=A0A7J6L0V5_PEROL|nr:hypothetical protein FOZ61_009135 [Perkinsus olseni]KAF4659184.1 hypothetical protein FOL46_006696 [Perkinsus olseni]
MSVPAIFDPVKPSFRRTSAVIRSGVIIIFGGYAANIFGLGDALDGYAADLWRACFRARLHEFLMFEALLSVMGFAIWSTVCANLWMFGCPKIDGSSATSVYHKEVWYWYISNAVGYLLSIYIYLLLGNPRINPAAYETPTVGRLSVEVAVGVFLYDALFYPIHYSFHRPDLFPAWWISLHRPHHDSYSQKQLTTLNTFKQHFADGAVQVMVNIAVQHFTPLPMVTTKHPLSRYIHNLIVTYLLIEAHSGYDAPWHSHRVWPWVFGGSLRHQLHHHKGTVNFHQFFKYMDHTFGHAQDARVESAAR